MRVYYVPVNVPVCQHCYNQRFAPRSLVYCYFCGEDASGDGDP